ncbi:MAG: hypothetical protein CUN54_09295, partial [Phototrophicales bacterium]
MRFLQRLMGITPPEPPLTGRREVNGVQYDVDTVSRNETAISIQLPCHQLVVPPTCYRKDDETFNRDYRFGPLIDCLFKLGAGAVDIGTRDSRLSATFDHRFVSIDNAFSEQAVAVMVNLRHQVIDAQPVAAPPKHSVAESTVEINGHNIAIQLYAAQIDTDASDGTFGNIELSITAKPAIPPETISQNVRIIIPGYDNLLDDTGYRLVDGGVELGFALLYLAADLGYSADQKRQDWLWQMVTTIDTI